MARLLLKVTLTLLIAAWLWPNPGRAAEVRKVKLGILQTGSQDFVHTVMEQQKFLQKYHIPYERISILNPPALHLMIAEKTVDIGYGGFTATARAPAAGSRRGPGLISPAPWLALLRTLTPGTHAVLTIPSPGPCLLQLVQTG